MFGPLERQAQEDPLNQTMIPRINDPQNLLGANNNNQDLERTVRKK